MRQVVGVLIRHGLGDVAQTLGLLELLPSGHGSFRWVSAREEERPEKLRRAIQELGATSVTLGRMLAIRPDILSTPYAEALARLDDSASATDFCQIKAVIQADLGRPVEDLFEHLAEAPMVSTSLGQIHHGRLKPGVSSPQVPDVRVDVLRPGIEKDVRVDLAILHELAGGAPSLSSDRHWMSRVAVEIEEVLEAALDLGLQVRNAERLQESLRESKRVRVASPIKELCGRRVLVSELVRGKSPGGTFPGAEADRRDLADDLWRAYLRQILVDGAFYRALGPDDPLLDERGIAGFPDLGAIGLLSRGLRLQLVVLLPALMEGDAARAAAVYAQMGSPGPGFRQRRFEIEVDGRLTRASDAPLGEQVLDLAKAAFRHDLYMPWDLILVGKTLARIESLCRWLNPRADPKAAAQEVASSVLADQFTRELDTHHLLATGIELRSLLTEVPSGARKLIERAVTNDLWLGIRVHGREDIETAVRAGANRIALGLLAAALVTASALLMAVETGPRLWGYNLFGLVTFAAGIGLGLYLAVKVILLEKR